MADREKRILDLEKEILALKIQLQSSELREKEITKNFNKSRELLEKERTKNLNNIIAEYESLKGQNMNSTLKLKELQTLAESWERIVDELAHSINTDVFVAVSALSKFLDIPEIREANHHIRQIRSLSNLLLLYLRKDDITYSDQYTELNLTEIVVEQIETVKDGISTLSLSTDIHEDLISAMEIPVMSSGLCSINIIKEFDQAVHLIIKDLIRNAIKHTTEENPKVTVTITGKDHYVEVEIFNNGAIPEKLADWFNKNSIENPENMPKSSKVGMRVVKKWVDLLGVETRYTRDETNNATEVRLKFPRRIKYEKDKNLDR